MEENFASSSPYLIRRWTEVKIYTSMDSPTRFFKSVGTLGISMIALMPVQCLSRSILECLVVHKSVL